MCARLYSTYGIKKIFSAALKYGKADLNISSKQMWKWGRWCLGLHTWPAGKFINKCMELHLTAFIWQGGDLGVCGCLMLMFTLLFLYFPNIWTNCLMLCLIWFALQNNVLCRSGRLSMPNHCCLKHMRYAALIRTMSQKVLVQHS